MSEIKEEVKAPVRVHKERSEENINISHISPSAAILYFTKWFIIPCMVFVVK